MKSRTIKLAAIGAAAFWALAGCAGDPATQPETVEGEVVGVIDAASEAEADVVCRSERATGSHLRTKVCRTRSEIEENEDAAREWIGSPLPNPTGPEGGG